MLLSEVQTRVKNTFGDTSGAVITDDDIARWASDAQTDIARKTKCNEITQAFLSAIGVSLVPISDVLSVSQVKWDGTMLRHYTRQQINQMYPNWGTAAYSTGVPHSYFLGEAGVNLFPSPSTASNVISVTYNRRPAPVVNPGDAFQIPESYHEEIVTRCLQRAYELDGQWSAADRKGAEYKNELSEVAHETKHKDDDSFPAIRSLPGDYGDA